MYLSHMLLHSIIRHVDLADHIYAFNAAHCIKSILAQSTGSSPYAMSVLTLSLTHNLHAGYLRGTTVHDDVTTRDIAREAGSKESSNASHF